MKKFLSLVLALVLTMSLVVIPANAAETPTSGAPEVTGAATAYVGEAVEYTATAASFVKEEVDFTGAEYTYEWYVGSVKQSGTGLTFSYTPSAAGTIKVKCVATTTVNGVEYAASDVVSTSVSDKYVLTAKVDKSTLYFNGTEASKTATVTATLKEKGDVMEDGSYEIVLSESSSLLDTNGTTISVASTASSGQSNITVTVTAKVDGKVVETGSVKINVADRYTLEVLPASDKTVKVTIGEKETLTAPVLDDALSSQRIKAEEFTSLRYSCINTDIAYVDKDTGEVTGYKEGETSAKATAVYEGKTYTVDYTIKVEPIQLKVVLDEVVNGDKESWDADDLESAVIDALNEAVSRYDGRENVTSLKVSSATSSGGKLYDDNDKALSSSENLMDGDTDLNFEAKAGFLGDAEFSITAVIDGVTYGGTMTIPVVAYRDDIDVTVSGEEDGKNVTFYFPDDYEYWYVYEGSGSFKDSMYSNYLSSSGWSKSYKAGASYSLKLSDFDDGNVTLYVVGIDDNVASTGKLEVALDSYDIEYSGTAGTTVTFEQDDFEDMLEEAAEDAGLIGKKNSTAYVEFDYVTFSPLPSSTKEGVLYNGSSKISKTTKCTDLDKVTFEIANKADSQVYIKFTVTAKYYKDDRSSTKATEKEFSGRVLVKVVHEDIKYTVPVDGSVVFKAEDFQDFYDDTHKNGTLSYVKFTELPKVTDGALYATYSAIYAGTVAKTSDKFYYDSSKASDYDLDDVTFRTSLWSKAGTKIYIPFEAYGTTSKTSKTVSGTPVKGWVAITVENARTMNFTDVKTSDWFYNNVKNAYTMGLIEGKTTTTFNPDDNMTYAEAVTLAARMNQLYYSGKVELSNSTTGNWYSSYESYAISKGIISSALGNKANLKITRKDYVDIFYNALPASAYTVRNTVSSIPDLANNTANAKVYAFYRAGILTGYANTPGKTNGAFGPNDNIKRSEVATILIRMMDSGTRVYFTM